MPHDVYVHLCRRIRQPALGSKIPLPFLAPSGVGHARRGFGRPFPTWSTTVQTDEDPRYAQFCFSDLGSWSEEDTAVPRSIRVELIFPRKTNSSGHDGPTKVRSKLKTACCWVMINYLPQKARRRGGHHRNAMYHSGPRLFIMCSCSAAIQKQSSAPTIA